jgi:hypothetical protein
LASACATSLCIGVEFLEPADHPGAQARYLSNKWLPPSSCSTWSEQSDLYASQEFPQPRRISHQGVLKIFMK